MDRGEVARFAGRSGIFQDADERRLICQLHRWNRGRVTGWQDEMFETQRRDFL